MHELGHTLTLAHGGTYYDQNNVASYEVNCKPNYLSVMSYLFQTRGFPLASGQLQPTIDYSGHMLNPLSETALDESAGVGSALPLTRWYGPPNALDAQLGTNRRLPSIAMITIGPSDPQAYRRRRQ
jgi:hypothetical protein